MSVTIQARSLSDLTRYFEELPALAEEAAVLAVNQVASRDGLGLIRKTMRKQVNFPDGYIEGERLRVTRYASRRNIEAAVVARDRPTSLARFTRGQTPANTRGRGVRVGVKPGVTRSLRSAFLVRLKNGNIGLAVRLKAGEQLQNSDKAVMLANNLYLLYGPSVDQVFRGVADDVTPDLGQMLSEQFLRQFARLSRG